MDTRETQRFDNVWDALAGSAEEASNLKARTELMRKIAGVIESNHWNLAAAAKHCGLTEASVTDILRGRLSRFSLDALTSISATLGETLRA